MAKKRKKKKGRSKGSSFGKKLLWVIPLLIAIASLFIKDISIGYYNRANGLYGAALKTAMHDIIRDHEYLNFDENTTARYWWDNYFKKTDWSSEGYFLDMYSNEKHTTYVGGNVQNREHCMPRSWWGKRDKYSSYDANGDLHNIFPSDYSANAAKSNLPLGEVGIAKFDNGVSKVGNNTYPHGYRGQVFEPADEYKGDFARVYFYMLTCYEDYSYDWKDDAKKSMLQIEAYPGLQPWALEMLIKWNNEDPISDKEIARNNAVYKIQGNRNPFVDCPELVSHIWGDSKDQPFYISEDDKINRQPQIKDLVFSYVLEARDIADRVLLKIKE
ncbi:endonuclease I family protein [Dysgonomonas sp. HGC4]|uniref:endonuclease I family protein n=1 Tax=Dysgonomonas sp. HGC4 TaxID=1658009 RepID=UPI0006834D6E|nr:endonuclease [Dysgonomonas sp. HGC4]MBD8347495.1 endonuclease [Dysgonomonas sp. HGC4]